MSFNDPISDFITRLKNASIAEHYFVDIVLSKTVKNIVTVLKAAGFIKSFLVDESRRSIRVFLRYTPDRKAVLRGVRRLSKPSCRRYVKATNIPSVLDGIGIVLISTSKGIMTGYFARKQNLGGELLCSFW